MRITVQSSKAVKPAYGGGGGAPAADVVVPLTVFDKFNYDLYISGINFFRQPAPPNAFLEAGLARALAEYREWAGRLGADAAGNPAILLNDAGARFVEAVADVALDRVMPFQPTAEALRLHPSAGDGAGELLLVQVTRFACGSFAVGYSMQHMVGDGRACANCILAWGQATRGAAFDPVPVHDRASLFSRLDPPPVGFQHRGVEFKSPGAGAGGSVKAAAASDTMVVERVRFSPEFVDALRALASSPGARPHGTLRCVAAHLWRCITRAQELDGRTVTRMRIAVDGRMRLRRPRVPGGYTGNVVLWARPAATAAELLSMPFAHAVELISCAVACVDDGYFRSFANFASSGAVEAEGLVTTADPEETVYCPDVDIDSLLHAPLQDLDFGGGPPFFFMPSYLQVEGSVFVVRSFSGDRSMDAYVPLFSRAMDAFKQCCNSLPVVPDYARL